MLNLHELNVFVEAAQAENFSLAAHRLHLSQPAVSLQVRHLERQLGLELFRRNGRNVALSETGKVLLPLAQELLRTAKHVEEVMWGLQGVVIGELTIACSTTVGKYVLPRLIAGFRRECPEVQVAVNVMSRRLSLEWLLDGRADFAVTSACMPQRDLDYQPFMQDRVILVVPPDHPWADQQAIKPEDLPSAAYIMREPTSGTYQALAEGLDPHGLSVADLKVVMTLGNAEAIEMSVEAGLGAAFISHLTAARGLEMGCIKEVRVRGLDLIRPIYALRHMRRPATPPMQAFWNFAFDPANEALRQMPAI